MSTKRIIAIVILIPFLGLTAFSIMEHSYIEIFTHQMDTSTGWQVLIDLCIALLLVFSWLVPEAKAKGRNPYPWVVATFFIGSIAPLLYLATDKTAEG